MSKKFLLSSILILGIATAPQLHGALENYPLEKAPLLTQTLLRIKSDYLETERIDPPAMFEASLNAIQQTVPEVLSECFSPAFCNVTVHQAMRRFNIPKNNLGELRAELTRVFQFIDLHADKDTERPQIEYSAINGLLMELDPHSSFMDPEFYREFSVSTEGEFGGLGLVVSLKEGQLTVMSPLEDTPAWKAGVKAGDKIVQIDDESTVNMSLTEAVEKLRGPVRSEVSVKIEREGRKGAFILKMKRAIINIEAVRSKKVQTPGGKAVAFLRVNSFQGNTMRDFYLQLDQLLNEEVAGIILDLRNNPGGLLNASIQLSDTFLKEGTIVSTVGRDGKLMDREKAAYQGLEGNWPLIVLVNEGSASAAEIVAGALKNNNRALILGHRTFGKGSVQTVHKLPLDSDNVAALKLTVAQYLTPGNQSIQSVGIVPDIEMVPVLVDTEQLDILPNNIRREADLEKHLSNAATIEERPAFRISYLEPKFEPDDTARYDSQLDLEKDITAGIALTLLDSIQSNDRGNMLREIIPTLAKQQAAENLKITKAFHDLGITWVTGETLDPEAPKAKVGFRLLQEGKPVAKALAGQEIELELSVTNLGKSPFYQLSAQSDAKSSLFQNIEFAFGTLKPGETRKWGAKLKLPKSLISEEGELLLKFQEARNHQPPDVPLIVPVTGHLRPRFSHLFHFEKGWSQKLKRGKPVDFIFEISNLGPGKAESPLAAIRNLEGGSVFIEKGRHTLKALKPGEKEKVAFRFHVDPKSKPEKVSLDFSLIDTDLYSGYSQKIILDLTGQETEPPQEKTYIPPAIDVDKLAAVFETPEATIKGSAIDDEHLRDLYIFSEEKKIFYRANLEEKEKLPFLASVPLKEGSNSIAITARDNYNLTSQHYLVLRYAPPPPPVTVGETAGQQLTQQETTP